MPALDRVPTPVSRSEAIADPDATLYGHIVPRRNGANGHHWRLRARLLGGAADGRAVELDSLIDAIAVYVVEGTAIACDSGLPHRGTGRFIGVYRLATGTGPEPPIYVAGI